MNDTESQSEERVEKEKCQVLGDRQVKGSNVPSDISGVNWWIKELFTQVKQQGWGRGSEAAEQPAQRLWGQEEQWFWKCWERSNMLNAEVEEAESQGPGQQAPCVDLGLKPKWDGNVGYLASMQRTGKNKRRSR